MTDNYGYIYCMSNKCMNGILKIGITNNNPHLRAKQLFNGNTGMPCEFEVKFSKRVKNPREVEKTIHNMLSNKRFPRREFFQVSEEEVRYIFSQFEGEWWDEHYDDSQNEYIVEEDTSSENAYDEPNEHEHEEDEEPSEEDSPAVKFMKSEKHRLTELKISNLKKHFVSINGKVKTIEDKEEALKEQMRALAEEKNKLRNDAQHKASEENIKVEIELKKCLAYLGEAKAQKTAQRKSSGEVVKAKSSTFFSRKPLNEMVNQNTRFIYEQKKGCVFKRFCFISKSENCVYECDENGTRNGQAYRSLNDFCVAVKKSVNYQGSLKQDTSVVLKYYDIAYQEYKSFKDLTSPLN